MKYASSITSSSLGNVLEWYDFGLFTIFSSLFSRIFFPQEDPKIALLATISIFSIGFFCRPLGALLFGYLGDRRGRAITLRFSILMISLPTLLIGVLPTYQQVGIFAPVLLTAIRMWQGISIGGEYSGNIIYLAEIAPKKHRAVIASFASMGANLGILIAAFVGIIATQVISTETLNSWGWRIPYLISGIFSYLIYQFRLRIHETTVFEYLKDKNKLTINPISYVFKNNKFELLRILGLVCMGSTFYYFCFIFLPIFLTENLHYSLHQISALITLFIGIMIILVPCAGWICDQLGRRKMLLFNSLLITLIVIPGFYFLQTSTFIFVVSILALFTIASSLEQGTTSISVVENFPPPARYTGISFAYNLGNGFLGGTVPLICEWLSMQFTFKAAPAIYIAFCAAITFCVVLFFVPETKNESLVK